MKLQEILDLKNGESIYLRPNVTVQKWNGLYYYNFKGEEEALSQSQISERLTNFGWVE